ncbi:hypothetical protein SEA_HONK_59 [Microbacterium phage Honk]|uniref:Uncharacterized protein n=1 Tax=Microbacterium phage Honk TaxID=2836095 RepID=A0A8F3E687_9CAUD|nr:hypothetical protein SEA_HONK_59 [Microbacterium phage Honk]
MTNNTKASLRQMSTEELRALHTATLRDVEVLEDRRKFREADQADAEARKIAAVLAERA